MTVTTEPTKPATVTNPHRVPTLLTGWAIPVVFLAALWGAGHHPGDAGVSAFAVVVMIALYLFNKARKVAFDRKAGR